MESTLPDQPSTPSLQSKGAGYRFVLLLTGNPEAAAAIFRAVLADSAEELTQLRSRDRRRALLFRRLRSYAEKWRAENPAQPDAETVAGRIAVLPEIDRCALALFLCAAPETSVETMAELLGLKMTAFTRALAEARAALTPGVAFPEKSRLREHRPWGGDRPKVAREVAAAAESPELAAQAEADARLYAEVGFLTVPPEILELVPAAPGRPCLRVLICQPVVLAIVLATLVVVGTMVYMARTRMGDFPGKETVEEFVGHLASTVEYEPFKPIPAGDLDDWFLLKGFTGFGVPTQLEKAKAVGGRIYRYNGLPLAEVELEAQNARLFVFHIADLKKTLFEPGRDWRFFQQDDWAVGVTRDDDNGYILVVDGDSDDLPLFLQSAGKDREVDQEKDSEPKEQPEGESTGKRAD